MESGAGWGLPFSCVAVAVQNWSEPQAAWQKAVSEADDSIGCGARRSTEASCRAAGSRKGSPDSQTCAAVAARARPGTAPGRFQAAAVEDVALAAREEPLGLKVP